MFSCKICADFRGISRFSPPAGLHTSRKPNLMTELTPILLELKSRKEKRKRGKETTMSDFTEERITHHGISAHVRSMLSKEIRCCFHFRVYDKENPDPKSWRKSRALLLYYDTDVNNFLASWYLYGSSLISRLCSWFPQHVFEQWDTLIFYLCQTILEKAQKVTSSGIGIGIDFYRYPQQQIDAAAAAAISVSVESIIDLQPFKYHHDDDDVENECAICFGKFERKGEVFTRLPCSHIFHYWCLAKWFKRKRTCPLCRYQALARLTR